MTSNKQNKILSFILAIIAIIAIIAFATVYVQLRHTKSELNVKDSQLIEAEQALQEKKADEIEEEDTNRKTGVSLVEAVYISSYANDDNKNMNVSNLEKVIIRDGTEVIGADGTKTITYILQDEDSADLVITVNSEGILVDASIHVYSDSTKSNVTGIYELSDTILECVVDYAKQADSSINMYSSALKSFETPETADVQ